MTIRELFLRAKEMGVADRPLSINYFCNDGWYNWIGDTNEEEVEVYITPNAGVVISIENC